MKEVLVVVNNKEQSLIERLANDSQLVTIQTVLFIVLIVANLGLFYWRTTLPSNAEEEAQITAEIDELEAEEKALNERLDEIKTAQRNEVFSYDLVEAQADIAHLNEFGEELLTFNGLDEYQERREIYESVSSNNRFMPDLSYLEGIDEDDINDEDGDESGGVVQFDITSSVDDQNWLLIEQGEVGRRYIGVISYSLTSGGRSVMDGTESYGVAFAELSDDQKVERLEILSMYLPSSQPVSPGESGEAIDPADAPRY